MEQGMAQFKKGESGNPAGRPVGARHKTLVALESLFDNEGEALSRKAIELALAGDMTAVRVCLDRVLPPRKDRPISFHLPKLEKPADAMAAVSAIAEGVATGALTPGEAGELSKLVDVFTRTAEAVEFEARIAALEGKAVAP
jgi:hypothetical protein